MRNWRVRRLPLRGADVVLMAHHPRWNGVGLGHNTILVVECDGPIESDRIARAWDRFLDVCPWPAARLRRPFPWGKLHWAAGPRLSLARPPLRRVTIMARGELQQELQTELNVALEPRREAPVRMLIVDDESARGTPSSVLVLTWFHPLMDARGGENLLTHLNELDRYVDAMPWGDTPLEFVSDRDRRAFLERSRFATVTAGTLLLPAAELHRAGPQRPARHPRDLLARRAGRQGDERAVASARSRRRTVPTADLGRCPPEG
jgi:hypothetical protein